MSSPRWSIIVFAACVAAVLAGLASLTIYTLGLERREFQSRADARHQELLRLALWRMDSALTPLLTRESSRPFFEYEAFVPANLGYGRMPGPIEPGQTIVPSPLLRPDEPLVKLYFARSRLGLISSPQVPPASLRGLAEGVFMSSYDMEVAEQRVRALSELMGVGPAQRTTRAQAEPAPTNAALGTAGPPGDVAPQSAPQREDLNRQPEVAQSANEYRARQQVAETASQTRNIVANSSDAPRATAPPGAPPKGERSTPEPSPQVATKLKGDAAAGVGPERPGSPPAANYGGTSAAPPTSASPVAPSAAPASPAPVPSTALTDAHAGPSATQPAADNTIPPVGSPGTTGMPGEAPPHADAALGEAVLRDAARAAPPDISGLLSLAPMSPGVEVGRLVPRWFSLGKGREPELVFVREVTVEDERFEQGFWLDWPALRATLLASAGDLTPGATLRPLMNGVDEADPAMLARTLAGIPVEFVAPMAAAAHVPLWSPARLTLLMTWCVSLLAILAIAMVLRAAMELAERRGRFVSAVTHELRTPLTTFCLYSQMLADGLIQGDEARATYLQTLKSESQRLARIVESVLEYARLGRQRPGHVRTLQSVASLIEQVAPPLERRCVQAGMVFEVQVEGTQDPASAMVAADAPTLERILYNLVDNACKYASTATDLRVHLVASIDHAGVTFSVRDHGPGIEPAERPRVFRAFVRGSREAAGTIPGLGLGLALAHGLAREIGAELSLTGTGPGARFDLRLPKA